MKQHDRTKLPIWAQKELERLERDVDRYKAKLSEGPEDSRAFLNPYSAAPTPLGSDPRVQFKLGKDRFGHDFEVNLTIDGNLLYVYGSGGRLAFLPNASNTGYIEVRDR